MDTAATVRTAHPTLLKRMFAFAGPAYLVSIGYMDPGNWATDIEGGARFGYQLLWVLVVSNAMAVLLQTLSARLGIVSGRDLAQACRESYPAPVSMALWVLCEIAIAACDLAELLGAAIGLNLLFGLPLLAGVLLSATDTLFILWFDRFGIRIVESIIISFIAIIGACFFVEIVLAKPVFSEVISGLVPRINKDSLYVAIAILGATVMPHNLYLHSSLVQTRRVGPDIASKRAACRFNFADSVIALNGALLVNAAILILAGSTFFKHGVIVTEIQQAHQMLVPLLGTTLAGGAFAVALLCSGQSSTITGTMAGQIVMEGFLNFRMRPWLRRFLTRAIAVIPAAITIAVLGDRGAYKLLIFSQVILSMQLPFAVVPLVRFTSDRARMGVFANAAWVKALAWLAAVMILALNAWLAATELRTWPLMLSVPLAGALVALLAYVALARPAGRPAPGLPPIGELSFEAPAYRSILVPLDHSSLDGVALAHAVSLARAHQGSIHLLHVEDDAGSQVYGEESSTAHVAAGRQYLESVLSRLRDTGLQAELAVIHDVNPKSAIVRYARELNPDLVVMGAHGHTGLMDVVFGTTINDVRHQLGIPVLVVRRPVHR